MHRLTGERQAEREQEQLDLLPARPHHHLTEVDLRLWALGASRLSALPPPPTYAARPAPAAW